MSIHSRWSIDSTMPAHPPPSRSANLSRASVSYAATTKHSSASYAALQQRPQSCRPRSLATKTPELGSTSREMRVRRWDGASRGSSDWDGLRMDPELWYPGGDCLVHLYGRGQSRRGPAFRLPMEVLLRAGCQPMLDRFLRKDLPESPMSDHSSSDDGAYFSRPSNRTFELYIPAPPTLDRRDAFLYHIATRNFFAWIFGRSLVGMHLGGALVGLLNSMTDFRRRSEDSVRDILDYIDEEGYGDMRNTPDHALGVLFFAENFHLRSLWLDAFAHCVGMHEKLAISPSFNYISITSRALITRSRLEMDVRLQNAGRRLGTFLSEDLSDAHLDLPARARSHLDKFRTFLQSFYIAKLGYYPPGETAFPKNIYAQMCADFHKLYDLLVDTEFTTSDEIPALHREGISVLQGIAAFDARRKHTSLSHPLPLLPDVEDSDKGRLSRRLSFLSKADKMKPDPRLVAFSSLNKATNQKDRSLNDCSLVRAYRGFEKECVFAREKNDKLSQVEGRKIRWILIYTVLQTLLSVTKVAEEVSDTQNVPYHLCALTAGCPPWKADRNSKISLRQQDTPEYQQQVADAVNAVSPFVSAPPALQQVRTEIELPSTFDMTHVRRSASISSTTTSVKGTVRRALRTLGNMPELVHPKPCRASFHEIVVNGYGNGTNIVAANETTVESGDDHVRKHFSDSSNSISSEEVSSAWSAHHADADADVDGTISPRSSISSHYDSDAHAGDDTNNAHHVYDNDNETEALRPRPLSVSMSKQQQQPVGAKYMKVTQEVKVEYEDATFHDANPELAAYLAP